MIGTQTIAEDQEALSSLRTSPGQRRMEKALRRGSKLAHVAQYTDTIIRFRLALSRRWRVLGNALWEEEETDAH